MYVTPYLTFNGNCREAMLFYRDCLGGELYLQTLADSPLSRTMPDEVKNYILHASLTTEKFTLMATDLVPDHGLIEGNSVALLIHCSDPDEMNQFIKKLADPAAQLKNPEPGLPGVLVGNLTDKFGKNWLLHCHI
ncbi:MAG: glyoxalase/bleomycin resistance/extradiol dioxygenase family protein [Bacteroidetes bacterium]|nr:glyoxalase/bleomycin resistance/extradiol dioxygenase family protein [Bacteroidota bacterium]